MPDTPNIPTALPADNPPPRPPDPPYRPHYYDGPPRRSVVGAVFGWFMRTFFILSVVLNLFLLMIVMGGAGRERLTEKHHSGDAAAQDKIAIVRIDGLIVEGFTTYAHRQLKDAAQDEKVKAIVIAIDSPGGSVTASDNLYKAIREIREGKFEGQKGGSKKVVASMGGVAASGGYYVALPAEKIYAQPTTMTGSIGVYAAFIDLHQLAAEHHVKLETIKRGELKGGSMFLEMSPEERLQWEMMVEDAYGRFLTLVRTERDEQAGGKRLKHRLRDSFEVKVTDSTTDTEKPLTRRLADGGVFTAGQAKEYGLVDEIGYLGDAVAEAQRLASLSSANVVQYERPVSLVDALLGMKSRAPDSGDLSLENVPGVSRRLWYLTPGFELEGLRIPIKALR